MKNFMQSIKLKNYPDSGISSWIPSKKPLPFWLDDLLKRHDQMDKWVSDLKTPKCLNITLL